MVRDRDIRFSGLDETETFPDFLETDTFQKHVSRPTLRDRDYIPGSRSMLHVKYFHRSRKYHTIENWVAEFNSGVSILTKSLEMAVSSRAQYRLGQKHCLWMNAMVFTSWWSASLTATSMLVIMAVIWTRVILRLLPGASAESTELSKSGYKCGHNRCTRTSSVVPVPDLYP